MNRYLLKFEKSGQLRYTSHLDLLRLFRRTFKRVGIDLVYSQGFNPHPKMSFAQPLSLGYTSVGEYLEFETRMPYNESFLVDSMNSSLPYGVKVLDCHVISDSRKTAASLVRWADYEVRLPEGHAFPTSQQLRDFVDQDVIPVSKRAKKGKETVEIDIKPMIDQLQTGIDDESQQVLTMKIRTGSESNLNPELLLASLFDFCGIPLEKYDPRIMRLELYREDGQPLSAE